MGEARGVKARERGVRGRESPGGRRGCGGQGCSYCSSGKSTPIRGFFFSTFLHLLSHVMQLSDPKSMASKRNQNENRPCISGGRKSSE